MRPAACWRRAPVGRGPSWLCPTSRWYVASTGRPCASGRPARTWTRRLWPWRLLRDEQPRTHRRARVEPGGWRSAASPVPAQAVASRRRRSLWRALVGHGRWCRRGVSDGMANVSGVVFVRGKRTTIFRLGLWCATRAFRHRTGRRLRRGPPTSENRSPPPTRTRQTVSLPTNPKIAAAAVVLPVQRFTVPRLLAPRLEDKHHTVHAPPSPPPPPPLPQLPSL